MGDYWSNSFTGGGFVGGVIGTGEFRDGDLSPERVIQYLSYAAVFSDVDVSAWIQANSFEDRFELSPIRWPRDFREYPRVQCYLASTRGDQVATRLTLADVRVFWGIRVAYNDSLKSLSFGSPSFDSLLHLIRKALMKNHFLTFEVGPNGVICPLARGGSNQDGEVNYLLDIEESSGNQAITIELPWLYKIKVDTDTGRLEQIIRAGG